MTDAHLRLTNDKDKVPHKKAIHAALQINVGNQSFWMYPPNLQKFLNKSFYRVELYLVFRRESEKGTLRQRPPF